MGKLGFITCEIMRTAFFIFFLALVIPLCVCMNGKSRKVRVRGDHEIKGVLRLRNAGNVDASTTEEIKKLFKALTKGDMQITIEDLTKQIVEARITQYGTEDIIDNIKQFDDGDNVLNFKEFQNMIIFDVFGQFVTEDELENFFNKLDGNMMV